MNKPEDKPKDGKYLEKKIKRDKNFARILLREMVTLCDDVYVSCRMKETETNYKLRQSTYNY